MRKVKHNKIRNTGLLFEFLLRQITSDVLNKNNGHAVSIVKEKFNENTELGKELALYNILITKKFISHDIAVLIYIWIPWIEFSKSSTPWVWFSFTFV